MRGAVLTARFVTRACELGRLGQVRQGAQEKYLAKEAKKEKRGGGGGGEREGRSPCFSRHQANEREDSTQCVRVIVEDPWARDEK